MTIRPDPLPQGSTIGILGGGQLARMLSLAASKLGLKTHIYCPDPESCAFDVTPLKTVASYGDEAALTAFAKKVDMVTYEFENVPETTANIVARHAILAPNANALAIAQDRLSEKRFLGDNDIPLARFFPASSLDELKSVLALLGTPAVLKTTRFGYDGKGQQLISDPRDAKKAFLEISKNLEQTKALVVEEFVPFAKEISIIVARNGHGEIACFDAAENVHINHILATSTVPAKISPEIENRAKTIAATLVTALNYIGVMGVEFFVSDTIEGSRQKLLVNEIAPRVHNSGHWSESVCATCQFEQHIRAICNWQLGATDRFADVVMENIIGEAINDVPQTLSPLDHLNLYGKSRVREGRKMGHINHIVPWSPVR